MLNTIDILRQWEQQPRPQPSEAFFQKTRTKLESKTGSTTTNRHIAGIKPVFFTLLLMVSILTGIYLGRGLYRDTGESSGSWENEYYPEQTLPVNIYAQMKNTAE